jgi:hypothetical protein
VKPRSSTGLLDRSVQQRDARLFVIAVEGERVGAEYLYFTELEARELLDRRRVKLVLLPADPRTHDSAPEHVLARIDHHAAEYRLRDGLDERWLVIDLDRWPERTLSGVCQAAHQARLGVALSNPCFELWLILHAGHDLAFLADVLPPSRSQTAKTRFRALRADGKFTLDRESIWRARDTAAALDVDPSTRWPHQTGTRMYRLVDALAAAGALRR